ncbi:ATPase, AAA-type, core [Cordyceps militaris CM01]|uniref:ATPase, AAA-type, core n=1 Tax=Cordyceps militaris (strain CM01) TaxID=983644 RepID=G3J742_CORMM|nr:ATPase, AAA-type, core [Cordyceps militaris CM01]EGX97115.1 ATPase, AAA-type, core [Cordyceps militaris CM01]
MSVDCPICNKPVKPSEINSHIDSGCARFIVGKDSPPSTDIAAATALSQPPPTTQKRSASSFFSTPAPKRQQNGDAKPVTPVPLIGKKRTFEEGPGASDASISAPLSRVGDSSEGPPLNGIAEPTAPTTTTTPDNGKLVKRAKLSKAAPLAERMRPTTLDDVYGQDLVGRQGVLRALIESDRVPSMILWGGAGTGKTTIARCIAHATGRRFVEINATSSSVGECKKLFQEAASDLALAGRRTIIFCDELHRFNKAQQDVFLRPVEAGTVTLIGATTENPSFKAVRGGDADAALYYLARMLQSGEDPLFVARRMVVIASEDVGLADSTLLPLATAAYTAAQQIGMPEARIPLAHCAVALCLAPKSTRAYRGLNNAYAALREPGVAALPVPLHLRNAPTRLMRDMGYGAEYKYPPNYRDGRVSQTYLPDELLGRRFLEDRDLGTEVDPDVVMKDDGEKA